MVAPEDVAHLLLGAIALGLEIAAALVIAVAAARAIWHYAARHRFLVGTKHGEGIRHEFGRGLLFGLDFAVGSDVLKVAIAPSLEMVVITGVVVLARVLLTLVVEHEVRGASRRHAA